MTTSRIDIARTGIVIPIGIYCYFGFELIFEKLRSFRIAKHKASINANQYVRKSTLYEETYPSSVDFRCKGTTKK